MWTVLRLKIIRFYVRILPPIALRRMLLSSLFRKFLARYPLAQFSQLLHFVMLPNAQLKITTIIHNIFYVILVNCTYLLYI